MTNGKNECSNIKEEPKVVKFYEWKRVRGRVLELLEGQYPSV
jgi:hypothetical protein